MSSTYAAVGLVQRCHNKGIADVVRAEVRYHIVAGRLAKGSIEPVGDLVDAMSILLPCERTVPIGFPVGKWDACEGLMRRPFCPLINLSYVQLLPWSILNSCG